MDGRTDGRDLLGYDVSIIYEIDLLFYEKYTCYIHGYMGGQMNERVRNQTKKKELKSLRSRGIEIKLKFDSFFAFPRTTRARPPMLACFAFKQATISRT
jgi:hypothetical protein